MGRYVTVVISTEGAYQVGSRGWGDIGMIGRSVATGVGAGELNTAYVITSPSDAQTLFGGDSALYNSILLAFDNGATKVLAVPTDVTEQLPETFNGDDSTTEFELTSIPTQPIDEVTLGGVPQTEGVDFYVDYGNKTIIFYDAPITGVDNVSITYSIHELTDIQDALDVLAEKDVQITVGSMIFDSAYLSEIKDYVIAATELPRIGVYMLKNGETAVTLAATLESEKSILIAHKSYKDVASAVAGRIAGFEPWTDLTAKDIKGIEQGDRAFTNTEIAAFDAVHIITMYDPPKFSGSAERISTGWTLDPSGSLIFIDQIRTILHLAGVIDFGLNNPNIIGSLRMNRSGLRELNVYIAGLLNPYVRSGAIERYEIRNPALDLFSKAEFTDEDIAEIQNLQASRRLEGTYVIEIKFIYSGTIIFIGVKAFLTGGV